MDAKKGPPVGTLRPLTDAEWAQYQRCIADIQKEEPDAQVIPREKLGADEIGCVYPLETRGARCGLCGKPMPPGEQMFNYHGYSGSCPTE